MVMVNQYFAPTMGKLWEKWEKGLYIRHVNKNQLSHPLTLIQGVGIRTITPIIVNFIRILDIW